MALNTILNGHNVVNLVCVALDSTEVFLYNGASQAGVNLDLITRILQPDTVYTYKSIYINNLVYKGIVMPNNLNDPSLVGGIKLFRFFINETVWKELATNTEFNSVLADGSRPVKLETYRGSFNYIKILTQVDMTAFKR